MHKSLIACVALCMAAITATAKADRYQIETVYTSGAANFHFGDEQGDYVINVPYFYANCGAATPTCYLVHVAATGESYYTTDGSRTMFPEVPGFVGSHGTVAPPPINFSGTTLGQGFYIGSVDDGPNLFYRGAWDGPDLMNDYVGNVTFDGGFAAGSTVYFIDGLHDGLDIAFDVAASPTPEPGSFVLLASGLLGSGALLRRRLQL